MVRSRSYGGSRAFSRHGELEISNPSFFFFLLCDDDDVVVKPAGDSILIHLVSVVYYPSAPASAMST
jgi:hypothetical protein